ncbi:hypothetical protein [Thalassotalea piscium]|uniref:Uncharacterized protein n=1 Tax=Thalassotalea piscium TaxID=1230533 RepID=A0A7X0TT76_9GAMM|nr:hypothetical protein [Thalassotalea piscium]MBB6542863.1 hypothetical protein [Thalassotalea piscium]
MANVTIGHVKCPIMGDNAEVRRDKKRKLYYVGLAGKMTPNLIGGQKWLEENTRFINGNGEPLTKVTAESIAEKIEITEVKPEVKPVNENAPPKKEKSLLNFLFDE